MTFQEGGFVAFGHRVLATFFFIVTLALFVLFILFVSQGQLGRFPIRLVSLGGVEEDWPPDLGETRHNSGELPINHTGDSGRVIVRNEDIPRMKVRMGQCWIGMLLKHGRAA